MTRWQLQRAQARFRDLIKSAQAEGPQEITMRGEPVAVVLSRDDYDCLTRWKPGFVQFMRQSPLVGVGFELDRDRSSVRR
jgi:prevent-host-death family protein